MFTDISELGFELPELDIITGLYAQYCAAEAQQKTVRQMADITGFPPTTVHRKLRKAHEKGYVPSPHPKTDDDDDLHSGTEQRPGALLLPGIATRSSGPHRGP